MRHLTDDAIGNSGRFWQPNYGIHVSLKTNISRVRATTLLSLKFLGGKKNPSFPQVYFDPETNGHKSFELPGAKPHLQPPRPGQVEHIFLNIKVDIPNQRYQGTCTIRLNPVRDGINRLTLEGLN